MKRHLVLYIIKQRIKKICLLPVTVRLTDLLRLISPCTLLMGEALQEVYLLTYLPLDEALLEHHNRQPLLINKSPWKKTADTSQNTTSKRSTASPLPTLNFHNVCVTLGAGPFTSPNLALLIKWHMCLQATWDYQGPASPVLRTHAQLLRSSHQSRGISSASNHFYSP